MNYKQLPTKRDIRDFFNYNPTKEYTVYKMHIEAQNITLYCKMKKDKTILIPPFYQTILSVDFISKKITLEIDKEHFQHLNNNVKSELNYLKSLSI